MSMSISASRTNSFFIAAAAAEPSSEKECDVVLKSPPLDSLPNVERNVAAVKAEVPNGDYSNGGTAGTGEVRGQRVLSLEEISRHTKEDDAWIVVDGKVFDVTNFLEIHPGGPELILDYLASEDIAKDAGPLMRGKLDEDGHSHSKAAFQMLQQFMVGSVEEQPDGSAPIKSKSNVGKKYRFDVDLTKPIVSQVGYLGPDYDEWVHDPVITHEIPRFFESDLSEFFTRTKWWVIPLVWVPVSMAMIYIAIVKKNLSVSRLPALIAGGILLWTALEYVLHRFLFHMKTSTFWWNTLHYVVHGFHHKHPMDGSRLVFPPMFALPIILGVYIALGMAFSQPDTLVLLASAISSYVAYDLTHYFLHFGTAFNGRTRQMKRYHLNHHFKDQTMGFGITSNVWDKVFRTLPPAGKPSMD